MSIHQTNGASPSSPSSQPVLEEGEDEYRPLPHVWSGVTLYEPCRLSLDKLKSVNSGEPLCSQAYEREPEESGEAQGNDGLTRDIPTSSSIGSQEVHISYSSDKGPNTRSDLPHLYYNSPWPEGGNDYSSGAAQGSDDGDSSEKQDGLNVSTIPTFPPSDNTSVPPLTPSQNYIQSRSSLFKMAFLIITCGTQLIVQSQLSMVMMPLHATAEWLGKPNNSGEMSWMAASYGYVLPFILRLIFC